MGRRLSVRRRCYHRSKSTECGGGGKRNRRQGGSRAGGESTMCPLGRTPLIPFQLEINESLILHPLLLPLSLPPLLSSHNHEFFCRRPRRVPLWQSYWSGGHRSRRSPGTLYLSFPHHGLTPELILDLPLVPAHPVPLLSPARCNLAPQQTRSLQYPSRQDTIFVSYALGRQGSWPSL